MKNRWYPLVLLAILAVVIIAAGLPSHSPKEYRFVQAGSWSTDESGERIGYTTKAAEIATELSGEGWELVSSSLVSEDHGRLLVLGFARPVEQ